MPTKTNHAYQTDLDHSLRTAIRSNRFGRQASTKHCPEMPAIKPARTSKQPAPKTNSILPTHASEQAGQKRNGTARSISLRFRRMHQAVRSAAGHPNPHKRMRTQQGQQQIQGQFKGKFKNKFKVTSPTDWCKVPDTTPHAPGVHGV